MTFVIVIIIIGLAFMLGGRWRGSKIVNDLNNQGYSVFYIGDFKQARIEGKVIK